MRTKSLRYPLAFIRNLNLHKFALKFARQKIDMSMYLQFVRNIEFLCLVEENSSNLIKRQEEDAR